MRGVAAVSAAVAVWAAFGGALPRIEAGRRWSLPPRHVGRAVAVGSAVAAGGALVSGVWVVAAAIGVLAGGAALAVQFVRAERRRSAVVDAWPDFLATVRSQLASGSPLPEAVVAASIRLGGPLEQFGRRVETSLRRGVPFPEALEAQRQFLADPVSDRVLTSLAFATGTGGRRVAEVLGLLGASVGDELRLRKAHDAALTQQRLTAAVALGAPWALLVLTVATNPQAAQAYATASGARVVSIGLALTVTGFVFARRSARLSAPVRIFR